MPYSVVVVERDVVPTAKTIVLPMVNDAHVSVVIQRHIARERQISSLVHRQVPGSSSPDVSLLSAGSVDSSCLCAVLRTLFAPANALCRLTFALLRVLAAS